MISRDIPDLRNQDYGHDRSTDDLLSDYENQQFKAVVPISPERLDNGVTISTTSSGVSIQFRKHEDEKEDSEKKLGVFARLFKSLLGGAE